MTPQQVLRIPDLKRVRIDFRELRENGFADGYTMRQFTDFYFAAGGAKHGASNVL